MSLPKLYMFYVGGDVGNSNIELHDVRFSIGTSPKACYEDLRAQWWGTPNSLHIDSWAEINQVDGFDITLSKTPFVGRERLYFLNLGGYAHAEFEEVHKNILVVAESQRLAIQKSILAQTAWKLPHKDALFEIEKSLLVSELVGEGYYLHLTKASELHPFIFESKYTRLHRKSGD